MFYNISIVRKVSLSLKVLRTRQKLFKKYNYIGVIVIPKLFPATSNWKEWKDDWFGASEKIYYVHERTKTSNALLVAAIQVDELCLIKT